MRRLFIFCFLVLIANFSQAAEGDTVWFFQSFTQVSKVITTDMNVRNGLSQLCRLKENSDLSNQSQPSYADDDSAFGHTVGGFVTVNQTDDSMAQCVYNSGPENNDNLYYLYVYAEQICSEGSQYDREKRACVEQASCQSGDTVLLAGISSALVQGSPRTVYVADRTPDSTCRKITDSSTACTFNKPAYTHSCYSDSPLSFDTDGNLVGTATGHCNYKFVNSGSKCTDTSTNNLPEAWGGYSLSGSSSEFDCADGITTPGCPTGDTGGDNGSGDGSSGGGSNPGTGGGSDGGSSGGGSDTGSGDGGAGGGTGSGTSSSASGTACGATLACTGDAVQCAILAQQKKTACSLADLTQVDQSALNSMLSGEKFQLEEKTVEATSLFERARFLPSACPAPETIQLSYGSFTIPYDFLCNFVDKFSFLLVLMATFVAMLIVFKD
ncbi:virulence factor TspB C-terminal domain-related protein [Pseudomonas putida]|uniref:virulence factor TspB C-terminal domain-related protein n=1 Tax=Pseudomonas putida TaxID=303 RepID=UPI0012D376D0|nr:virulence factor TspB C-terminal domain-related protein [Pseudomonas putida]